MCRFGSGEVRRLDFLLRGPEGSTAKPSQPLDSTPVERKVQGRRRGRGVASGAGPSTSRESAWKTAAKAGTLWGISTAAPRRRSLMAETDT